METYYPIPDAVHVSDTKTGRCPADACARPTSGSVTVNFDLDQSAEPRLKKPDFQAYSREADTTGKFSDIKKSSLIKMTPMKVVNEKRTYYVASMQRPFHVFKYGGDGHAYSKNSSGKCGCYGYSCRATVVAEVSGRYHEQGDLDYWKSKYPDLPHLRRVDYLDTDEIEAAKADAYSELFTGYGLGEELAELKDSIHMLYSLTNRAFKILTQFRTTLDALKLSASPRMVSEQWMEFRYGIMPIVYSISDVIGILQEKGRFRTVRQKVKPKFDTADAPSSECYWEDLGTSSITCNVTAKASWLSQELKMVDLVDINFITTGLQVMSWSMVINWFFNIYSFTAARVKAWTTLSSQHCACVGIRTRMEYGTYLNFAESYYHHLFSNGDSSFCGAGYYGYLDFGIRTDTVRSRLLLSWNSIDNYHRYLYQPSDVNLVYDPFIDWRRAIDGTIMGWGQLSKALRRLL